MDKTLKLINIVKNYPGGVANRP